MIVGDLRTAINYGAVATSEQLVEQVERKKGPDDKVRRIDQRSYFEKTPMDGWEIEAEEYRKKKLESIMEAKKSRKYKAVQIIRSSKIYYLIRKLWRFCHTEKQNGRNILLPDNYDEFEEYGQLVFNGELFNYEANLIKWADLVIINAEGAIVKGRAQDKKYKIDARYVLFMSYLARTVFKKKCYIINHCVDPDYENAWGIIKKIYPLMNGIYVREWKSYGNLKAKGIYRNVRFIPDVLFTFETNKSYPLSDELKDMIDFSKPYICLGDSSAFDSSLDIINWNICATYKRLVRELKKVCPQIVFVDGFMGWNSDIEKLVYEENLVRLNLCNCSYEQLFEILKGSQLFISGRWHASILALLGGTPVLLWGADSFKTKALYELIDYPYAFFDVKKIPDEIEAICIEAERINKDNISKEILKKVQILKEQAYDNFDML